MPARQPAAGRGSTTGMCGIVETVQIAVGERRKGFHERTQGNGRVDTFPARREHAASVGVEQRKEMSRSEKSRFSASAADCANRLTPRLSERSGAAGPARPLDGSKASSSAHVSNAISLIEPIRKSRSAVVHFPSERTSTLSSETAANVELRLVMLLEKNCGSPRRFPASATVALGRSTTFEKRAKLVRSCW